MPQASLPRVNGFSGAALKPTEIPRPLSLDDSLVLVLTKDTRIPNSNPALCCRYRHLPPLHGGHTTPTTSLLSPLLPPLPTLQICSPFQHQLLHPHHNIKWTRATSLVIASPSSPIWTQPIQPRLPSRSPRNSQQSLRSSFASPLMLIIGIETTRPIHHNRTA